MLDCARYGIFFWTVIFSFIILPVSSQDICEDSRLLLSIVRRHHLNGLNTDSVFYELSFLNYIRQIDPDGKFLTGAQRRHMKETLPQVKRDARLSSCNFLEDHIATYENSLKSSLRILDSISMAGIPEHSSDTLFYLFVLNGFEPKETPAATWASYLRFQTLVEMRSVYDGQKDSARASFSEFKALFNPAFERVVNREYCQLERKLNDHQQMSRQLRTAYLNALMSACDPHSAYLSIENRDAFQQRLSRNILSFGFELEQRPDGRLTVVGVIPGGPAWDSGKINEGDVLLGMRMSGITREFNCSSLEEINELLFRDDVLEAEFKFMKAGRQEVTVTLVKELVGVSENTVEGFVLKGKAHIGYLALPSFFNSGTETDKTGATHDIARELLYLQDEKIKGLILDLRNNGGGSVKEAVDLAGLFINEGPLFIHRGADNELTLIKDMHRGYVYGGPVIILINGQSASASELFAAAMQDHHRGIVMGSRSFGKSTGQQILPLARISANGEPTATAYARSLRFLKITTSQYYRLDGTSIQQAGVEPDIQLPEQPILLNFREKNFSNAIPAGKVKKKIYFEFPPVLPLHGIRLSAMERLDANPYFNRLREHQELMNGISIPLHREGFFELVYGKPDSGMENIRSELFEVINHSLIEGFTSMNNTIKRLNGERRDEIKNDPYINEAYLTMMDLINFK